MEYRRFENTIFLRLDPQEELLEQLKHVAQAEQIKLAAVNGLGAVNRFTVGVFDTEQKQFVPQEFQGCYEIVSLHGSINTFHGEYYAHLHMSAGDRRGQVVGGHLTQAVISATGELVLNIVNASVDRRFDPETGLNIFDFDDQSASK